MPNLAEIVGRPLPDSGMPTGTVSVRVARKMPSNGVAGAEVSAVIKNAGGDLRRRTEKTDADGRALFEGMAPGDEFHAEVTVDGELLEDRGVHHPAGGRAPDDADRRARQGRRQCGAGAEAAAGRRRCRRWRPERAVHAGRHRGRRDRPTPACRRGASRSASSTRAARRSPTSRCCWGWSTRPTRSTSATARATRPAWRTSPIFRAGRGPATRRCWNGTACASARRPSRCRRAAARAPRSARSATPPTRR